MMLRSADIREHEICAKKRSRSNEEDIMELYADLAAQY